MAPAEKLTYFGYNEGHDPSILRIGTLALDFANPRTKKPYIHPEVKHLLDPPPQATADERTICYLSQSSDKGFTYGIGLQPFLELETSRQPGASRLVVGKNGSKVELIDPDDFFEKVLAEEKARIWLQTRLSVAHNLKAKYKNIVGAPTIWFLTGVYFMEDAVTFSVTSKSTSNTLSSSVPVFEPTGIAALLGMSCGATISLSDKIVAQAGTQILGKKVWAAQWRKVHARYAADPSLSLAATHKLRLLDIWSIETRRGTGDGDHFAHVSLTNRQTLEESTSEEEVEEEYSEDMWDKFMTDVDSLLDDLEEE